MLGARGLLTGTDGGEQQRTEGVPSDGGFGGLRGNAQRPARRDFDATRAAMVAAEVEFIGPGKSPARFLSQRCWNAILTANE